MPTKRERIARMRKENDEYYKSLGWKPGRKDSPHKIPDYSVQHTCAPVSDAIPGPGPKRGTNRYTGEELLGIATLHKSNAVPVRRDNKKAATDISQMRRN